MKLPIPKNKEMGLEYFKIKFPYQNTPLKNQEYHKPVSFVDLYDHMSIENCVFKDIKSLDGIMKIDFRNFIYLSVKHSYFTYCTSFAEGGVITCHYCDEDFVNLFSNNNVYSCSGIGSGFIYVKLQQKRSEMNISSFSDESERNIFEDFG